MSPQAAAEEEVILETAIKKEYLAETLEILQTLSSEARFNFGREGLRVHLVDPANVAMHYLDLGTGAFENVPEGQVTVGLNLERLDEAIGKADGSDVVTLGYLAETRMLNVSYGNVTVNIAGIDTDSIREEPDKSDLDFTNEFVVERDEFADALDIADMVSDHVAIECDPDERQIEFIGEGDLDDSRYTMGHDEVISATVEGQTRSMYSTDYLWGKGKEAAGIVRAIPSVDMTIRQSDEYPMDMEYSYADGNGSVLTRLAPRIESG